MPLSQVLPMSSAPALQQGRRREAHAEKCALIIFGAYNRSDVGDPEIFVANTIAMLAQFPEAVMTEVCSPRTGIQTRIKWPPKPPELREWCERISAEHANSERRAMLNRHGALIDTPRGPEPLDAPELTPQELRDRAVARWENEVRPELVARRNGEAKPKETPTEALKRLAAEAGNTLTDADIARLPNARPRA